MSLAGFGGVLVWARRGIVDQHRWMTAEEFNETFACAIFCRARTSSICPSCSARAFAALPAVLRPLPVVGPPLVIATVLAACMPVGEIDALRRILAGVSCAAVGLLIAVVCKMTMPLVKKRDAVGSSILVAVFVAIGVLRLPLQMVLLVAIR